MIEQSPSICSAYALVSYASYTYHDINANMKHKYFQLIGW